MAKCHMLVNATVSTLKRPKLAAIIDWEYFIKEIYNNKAPIGSGYKSLATVVQCQCSLACINVHWYVSKSWIHANEH